MIGRCEEMATDDGIDLIIFVMGVVMVILVILLHCSSGSIP